MYVPHPNYCSYPSNIKSEVFLIEMRIDKFTRKEFTAMKYLDAIQTIAEQNGTYLYHFNNIHEAKKYGKKRNLRSL